MFPHLNRSDGSSTFTSVGLKGLCKFFILSFLYNFDFGEKWNVFRSFQVINCLTWCSKNVTVEEARFCDMFVCTIKTTLSLSLWSQKFTVGHSVYNRTHSVPIFCKSAESMFYICVYFHTEFFHCNERLEFLACLIFIMTVESNYMYRGRSNTANSDFLFAIV